ncbi:paf1 domain-containing protein [Sarocladium implicatum]|nr:paf1 domain-containing protein [Sarocladium implicatum]
MASGTNRPDRVIHQDFIARIRFSNALPPPPVPPKLLDVPNTGLASGQYTNPGFASRLAREQPLNIEVDAELGMPLDLVGMPGVFDGDESSIQPPAQQPPVHPHDRALLRPLAALGKPKVADANVSFLRRTEYISNLASSNKDLNGGSAFIKNRPRPRKAPEASADSPAVIKRKIDKSFELAEQYLKDPKKLKHPTKKHVTIVDARPLLPDSDAMPDSGAYVSVKFLTNPVQSDKYDTRLLKGIFRPTDKPKDEEEAYEEALRAHEQDPANYPKPQNLMNYEFYLADSNKTAEHFKRKMDPEDPDRESDALYTSDDKSDGKCFHFNKLRAYETADEVELDAATKYDLEVLLSHNDDEQFPRQKAVYYYPVIQKIQVRPQRTRNIYRNARGFAEDEENVIHQLDVTINDPSESSLARMGHYSKNPLEDPEFEDEAEQEEPLEEADEDEDVQPRRRRSPSENRETAGDSAEDDDEE